MHKLTIYVTCTLLILTISLFAALNQNLITSAQQDLMQYEWPIVGGDAEHTGYSAGPAPDSANILWKTDVGFPGFDSSFAAVFDGKVFVIRGPFMIPLPTTLLALDAFTGDILWEAPLPIPSLMFTKPVYKLGDDYVCAEAAGWIMCFNIDDGTLVWTYQFGEYGNPSTGEYWNGQFAPEMMMKYGINASGAGLDIYVEALDMSNPAIPPTIAWQYRVEDGSEVLCYGDGKVFVGTSQWNIYALNATTGELLWRSPKYGISSYSATYYRGKLYHTSGSNRLTCYNASTGEILWDYYAGGRSFFAFGGCAAYGRYFQHNIELPISWVGSWDVDTGDLLWKDYGGDDASYAIGYLIPVVADGKVYVTTGDGGTLGSFIGTTEHFTCYDAFSGARLWRYPITCWGPAIAYGNVYCPASDGFVYCFTSEPQTPEDWPMFRRDPTNPGITSSPGPTNLNIKWSYETGGPVVSSPSIVDGKVYVGSYDKNLYCLDAYDGDAIWNFTIGARMRSSPAVVGGRVYTGADDGYVYCLNSATGVEIWNKHLTDSIDVVFNSVFQPRSSPIVVGNKLYVGSLDNKIYCLSTSDGSILWEYETGNPVGGSATVADGVVYISSSDNHTYALDADNGTLLWKTLLPIMYSPGRGLLSVAGSPAVGDGLVFVSAGTDAPPGLRLFALNITQGAIVWNVSTWSFIAVAVYPNYSPTYLDGVLYIIEGMFAAAYNATDGTRIWQQWLGFQSFTSPTYADGRIYVGTDIYSIQCLDAATGTPIAVYTTQGHIHSTPAIWESKLYVGSADWHVYCFADYPTVTSSIEITLEKTEIDEGDSIIGSGQLFPQYESAPVKVTFVKPSSATVDVDVATLENGGFEFTYTPDEAGWWTATGWYEGEEYDTHEYTYAYTEDISFKVVAEEQPTNGNGNGNGGNGDGEDGAGIPMEYIYALVAIIAIIVIVGAAYVYMKKK